SSEPNFHRKSRYRTSEMISDRLSTLDSFPLMRPRVYIETFGCQMNVADTERAATGLKESGYDLCNSEQEADVVLINTCSVREKAEQKAFTRVGEIRAARPNDRKLLVGLMGCVAQLEGEAIFEHSPSINMVIGTRATDRISS